VSRTALGHTQPIKWVPGVLSLGVKWAGHAADHSPPSSAEVKEWVELYLPSPNTPPWYGAQLKYRDNFTFYSQQKPMSPPPKRGGQDNCQKHVQGVKWFYCMVTHTTGTINHREWQLSAFNRTLLCTCLHWTCSSSSVWNRKAETYEIFHSALEAEIQLHPKIYSI
jgi:hypothetical protein